jgi:hypothetical protein
MEEQMKKTQGNIETPEECMCDKCPRRFICYTQERVFSDPRYQALFEAELALGKEKEEAIESVKRAIEADKITKHYPMPDGIDSDEWNKWKKYDKIPWDTPKKWVVKEPIGETYPRWTRALYEKMAEYKK